MKTFVCREFDLWPDCLLGPGQRSSSASCHVISAAWRSMRENSYYSLLSGSIDFLHWIDAAWYTLALYRPNKYIDIGVHCGLKSNIGAHFQECHGIRSLYCCFLFIKLEYFHLIKSKIYEAINVTNHNIPFHLFFKKFIHWINVLTICNLIKTYFCSTDKERLTFFELLFVKINRMHNMDIAIGKCGLVRSKKPFF